MTGPKRENLPDDPPFVSAREGLRQELGTRDRTRINPDGRYPADAPRLVEAHALQLLPFLPGARIERTRDAIQIDCGGEKGIVLLLTPEALELRLPDVEWTTQHGPAASSRLWKRLEWEQIPVPELRVLVEDLLKLRREQFKPCRFCGQAFPPERRFEEDVCYGCAERHLGVVF